MRYFLIMLLLGQMAYAQTSQEALQHLYDNFGDCVQPLLDIEGEIAPFDAVRYVLNNCEDAAFSSIDKWDFFNYYCMHDEECGTMLPTMYSPGSTYWFGVTYLNFPDGVMDFYTPELSAEELDELSIDFVFSDIDLALNAFSELSQDAECPTGFFSLINDPSLPEPITDNGGSEADLLGQIDLQLLDLIEVTVAEGQIIVSGGPKSPVVIKVFSANGQLIASDVLQNQQIVETNNWPSAWYMVYLEAEGISRAQKIFVR